jgi:hypothetical protein
MELKLNLGVEVKQKVNFSLTMFCCMACQL